MNCYCRYMRLILQVSWQFFEVFVNHHNQEKLSKEETRKSKENKFVDKYSTITNTAIFNISLILPRVQKVVLGLGTKYIPYPESNFRDRILKMTDSISAFYHIKILV